MNLKTSDMNIVEIIKKAPKDHVYYCTIIGECRCKLEENNLRYPIRCFVAGMNDYDKGVFLTSDGKLYTFEEYFGSECVLFPSRDNRDWEAFERELDGKQYVLRRVFGEEELPLSTEFEIEGGGKAVLSRFCGISGINLDHEYYKEHPYIDFQIDGKEYKVSIEDMKRLAMSNADGKAERMSGQSFDGTAEMVSIPDRPMMAAVIMSGLLAGGCKDKGGALVNKALHLADLILDETETKTKED